jgi:hypothetical protein
MNGHSVSLVPGVRRRPSLPHLPEMCMGLLYIKYTKLRAFDVHRATHLEAVERI